ncbi:MAG: hypothetical protein KIT09_19055 [Bryobacteraceae bacterium]|nr:hypothetical protein [Bryobacteraceae bacterium]
MTRATCIARIVLLACAVPALADHPDLGQCSGSAKVGCVVPNLFGEGITLSPAAPGQHVAHFQGTPEFFQNFLPLNTAIATQLTLLPIASPASGFTYEFSSATGVYTRTAQSFGPILTERGETLGRKRVFLGFSYQRFWFDKIEGLSLGSLPGVLTHEDTGRALQDIVTTSSNFDLKIDQFTFFGTVGLTNRFDVSLAVPVTNARLRVAANAQIQRVTEQINPGFSDCPPGSGNPCHFFPPGPGTTSSLFTGQSEATGIGDITLRLKHSLFYGEHFAAAILTDVRFPTGDELEFLGAGAVGVKPFLALTLKKGRVAPHANIGYQWNGASVLAGNILTGEKRDLPNQFFYSLGADIGVAPERLTVVADLLGQRLFDAPRVTPSSFTAANNQAFPQLGTVSDSFGLHNAAIGFKLRLVNELLLTANLLFRVDDSGLRQRAAPLIGLSYSF